MSDILRWGAHGLAGAAALCGGVLFVTQKSLVFQQRKEHLPVPLALEEHLERLWLATPSGDLRAWWVEGPTGSERVVLLFPGAIGNVSHESHTIEYFRNCGASVLAIDYPGYGESGGDPSERAFYQAADAAFRFLTQKRGAASSEIVVFGRSLGSVLALHVSARAACRGVILHSSFLSIPDVAASRYPFLPVRPFCLIRFQARAAAESVRSPVLFIHAEHDRAVPLRLGRRCYSRVRAPKRFLVVPGGHAGALWTSVPMVRTALEELWSGQAARWS